MLSVVYSPSCTFAIQNNDLMWSQNNPLWSQIDPLWSQPQIDPLWSQTQIDPLWSQPQIYPLWSQTKSDLSRLLIQNTKHQPVQVFRDFFSIPVEFKLPYFSNRTGSSYTSYQLCFINDRFVDTSADAENYFFPSFSLINPKYLHSSSYKAAFQLQLLLNSLSYPFHHLYPLNIPFPHAKSEKYMDHMDLKGVKYAENCLFLSPSCINPNYLYPINSPISVTSAWLIGLTNIWITCILMLLKILRNISIALIVTILLEFTEIKRLKI